VSTADWSRAGAERSRFRWLTCTPVDWLIVTGEGHVPELENGGGYTSRGGFRARVNSKTDQHLPRLKLRVRAPWSALGAGEGRIEIDRAATVIPYVRVGLVTIRPSSRYENKWGRGEMGTPNRPLWMSTRFQRIPLRAL
jgi:hypothetical protein